MLYAIVGLLVIILDQGVKFWVTNNIMLNTVTEPLIPGILSLVRMHNDGAAFSFLTGGGARIYFIILTGVFTLAVILALATRFIRAPFGRWCLVLVTAGGLSNCLDRILYGYVVDMFKIDMFDFAVFNVADVFITLFSLLFILHIIFGGETARRNAEDEFDEYDDEAADSRSLKKDMRDTVENVKSKKPDMKLSYEAEDRNAPRRKAARRDEPERTEKRPASKSEAQQDNPKRRPANETAQRPTRSAQLEADDVYAIFAEKKAAQREAEKASGEDPFAAWENANLKAEAKAAQSSTAKAMGVTPTERKRPERPAPAPKSEYTAPERPKVAPAPAPAPKPKAKVEEEFNLDDILAEFK